MSIIEKIKGLRGRELKLRKLSQRSVSEARDAKDALVCVVHLADDVVGIIISKDDGKEIGVSLARTEARSLAAAIISAAEED